MARLPRESPVFDAMGQLQSAIMQVAADATAGERRLFRVWSMPPGLLRYPQSITRTKADKRPPASCGWDRRDESEAVCDNRIGGSPCGRTGVQ